MKHSQIQKAAYMAATSAFYAAQMPIPQRPGAVRGGGFLDSADSVMTDLYDYARQRAFPPAETLARKFYELQGVPVFPHASIADMTQGELAFFRTFRATADTLEPLHEPDPERFEGGPLWEDQDDSWAASKAEAEIELLRANAAIGASLMAAIEAHSGEGMLLHGWSPAEDPAEVVGDLVVMLDEQNQEVAGLKEAVLEGSKDTQRLHQLQAALKGAKIKLPDVDGATISEEQLDILHKAGAELAPLEPEQPDEEAAAAGVTAVEPDQETASEASGEGEIAPKSKSKKK